MDAIRADSEGSSNHCEACSKKLTELWMKQVDPPPSKEALDRAVKKAYSKQRSKSTQILITSAVAALLGISLGSYYSLVTTPLLYESLPTNVVMFGGEEDLNNLTRLWMDEKVQFINVYGPPGWGKSTLVMRFGHQVVEGGTSVVYVNMNDTDKFSMLQRDIRDKIPQCGDTQDLPHCIGKQFDAAGLLIILDNTDFVWFEKETNAKLESFMESLQKYSATVKVIITSRQDMNWKPLDGFATYTPLKVSNETCHEIFLHKHEDSRLAQKVCQRLGNMPLPVKLVASRFADSTDLCEEDECIAEWEKFEDAVHFSYKHLNRSTQVCTSLLVRFPGSFTLVAVRSILPEHMGDTQATKCLTSLLKYSFLDRRQYKQSGDILLVDLKDRLQFHMLIKETIFKFLSDDSYYSSNGYNILLFKFGSNFFTYYEPCMVKFWESMDTVWNMSNGKIQTQEPELTHELELQHRAAAEEQVLSGRLVGMTCFAEYVNINSLFAFLPANGNTTLELATSYSEYKWYSPQTLLTIFPFMSGVFIGDHSILTVLEGACHHPNFGLSNPVETITALANMFNSALGADLPTPICPDCDKSQALIQRMSHCVEKIEQLAHIGSTNTINATAIFYGTLYHLCICQTRSCRRHSTTNRDCVRVWEYWLKANVAPLYINFCNFCIESFIENGDLNFAPRLCRSCNSSLSLGIRSYVARNHVETIEFIKQAIEEERDTSCSDLKRVIGAMILYSIGYCCDDSAKSEVQYVRHILPDRVHCLPQLYSHFEPFFTELNVTNVELIIRNNSKIPAASIIACLREIIDVFGEHHATPRSTFGWVFPNCTAEYDYFHELWNNFSTLTSFMDYSNGRLVHRTIPIQVSTLCLLQYDWDSLLCSLMKVAYL